MLDNRWHHEIQEADDLKALESLRVHILGKNGVLTQELKSLSLYDEETRKIKGASLNSLKTALMQMIQEKRLKLEQKECSEKVDQEKVDITLKASPRILGRLHPLTCLQNQIIHFFYRLGFVLHDGPELEDEFHNFDALNVPLHHPARQAQDTFYVGEHLLRSHTTTVQIRCLETLKPPLRILSVGRVYRSDALDATHTPMFHQFEGLVIEPRIHMGHLKGVLVDFCKYIFEKDDISFRFRPSFFPFTEPSAELDLAFSQERWLEILGCGMVHPDVLRKCGLDPSECQGFAFGGGVEILLMLKYVLTDIRHLYTNDADWLEHYGSYPFEVHT